MKNKKVLIIIFIILIIIIIFVAVLQKNQNNKDKDNNIEVNSEKIPRTSGTLEISNELIKKIETGEELLIYFSNSNGTCTYCEDTIKFVEYLKDLYKLNLVYYDINKLKEEDVKKIEKYFNVFEGFISAPTIFMVRDGNMLIGIPELSNESYFIEELINNGFIKKEVSIEKYIDNSDSFKNIYSSNENILILLYTYMDNSYTYRKKIYNIGKKYNFSYNLVMSGLAATSNITKTLRDSYEDRFQIPSLVVVSNNKVIDYTASDKEDEIVEFLKKNKIIK